jgi:hypothetical protein
MAPCLRFDVVPRLIPIPLVVSDFSTVAIRRHVILVAGIASGVLLVIVATEILLILEVLVGNRCPYASSRVPRIRNGFRRPEDRA